MKLNIILFVAIGLNAVIITMLVFIVGEFNLHNI